MGKRVKQQGDDRFYFVEDVKQKLGYSDTKSYGVIRSLNDELKSQGKMVFAGRVPKNYFDARCGVAVAEKAKGDKVVMVVV
jgi:hypothetical protein